jgi:disulfide bond formation protein DsbB
MKYNETAVFKWVMIFAVAVGSAILLTKLTSGLVGALYALILAIIGCAYGIRWSREWWHNARDRPGGPDHKA